MSFTIIDGPFSSYIENNNLEKLQYYVIAWLLLKSSILTQIVLL